MLAIPVLPQRFNKESWQDHVFTVSSNCDKDFNANQPLARSKHGIAFAIATPMLLVLCMKRPRRDGCTSRQSQDAGCKALPHSTLLTQRLDDLLADLEWPESGPRAWKDEFEPLAKCPKSLARDDRSGGGYHGNSAVLSEAEAYQLSNGTPYASTSWPLNWVNTS